MRPSQLTDAELIREAELSTCELTNELATRLRDRPDDAELEELLEDAQEKGEVTGKVNLILENIETLECVRSFVEANADAFSDHFGTPMPHTIDDFRKLVKSAYVTPDKAVAA